MCWFCVGLIHNQRKFHVQLKLCIWRKHWYMATFFLLSGPTKEDIDKDTKCSKEYPDCCMRFFTTLTRCWQKFVYDWCLRTRPIMKPVLLNMNYKCKLFQHKTLIYIQTVAFSILKQNFNLKKIIVSHRDSIFGQVNGNVCF